jgi:hypothetical protein
MRYKNGSFDTVNCFFALLVTAIYIQCFYLRPLKIYIDSNTLEKKE